MHWQSVQQQALHFGGGGGDDDDRSLLHVRLQSVRAAWGKLRMQSYFPWPKRGVLMAAGMDEGTCEVSVLFGRA